MSPEQMSVHIGISSFDFISFRQPPGEVNQCIHGLSPFDGLIGPVKLRVGFFDQRHPELGGIFAPAVDEVTVLDREAVVDDHIHPAAETPEAEMDAAPVPGSTQRLVIRNDLECRSERSRKFELKI